jgi:preprotein translocase subunit SecE
VKKTIFIIIIFTAAFLALYEQSKAKPNVIVMVIAIVIFMLGLMQLMSKIPDKNQDKNEDDV